jgi:hypothetical protein
MDDFSFARSMAILRLATSARKMAMAAAVTSSQIDREDWGMVR